VNATVTEVSDQQVAGERTEVRRQDSQAPRRIEHPAAREALHERPVVGEHVDEPVALARDVIRARGVLLGIGDEHLVADLRDVEGRVPARQVGVVEEQVDRQPVEAVVEHVDPE
jgi:hypothetical protein